MKRKQKSTPFPNDAIRCAGNRAEKAVSSAAVRWPPWSQNIPWLLSMALFLSILVCSAWLCDDAFISFRTADNFVNGFGLTWNVQERVQAYTHPLWLFLFSIVYYFTREPFYTGVFVSMAVSVAAVGLFVWKIAASRAAAALGVLTLTFSVAFVDFSTSGLENPLTHLLLALFVWFFVASETVGQPGSPARNSGRTPLLLSLLASLAAVNRMDTILFFIPALAYVLQQRRSLPCLAWMALGSLPLIGWLVFSSFYYGFPFPNTAYAKLNNGVPAGSLAIQGCYYLWNSLKFDPITLVAIVAGVAFAVWHRTPRRLCVAAGIVLYVLYIVKIGGDFMSGRFLTGPLFAAVCLLGLSRWNTVKAWGPAACAIAVLAIFSPRPFSGAYGDFNETPERLFPRIVGERGVCDERMFYFAGSGLLRAVRQSTGPYPNFSWAMRGRRLRAAATNPDSMPTIAVNNIGFLGFYGGPNVRLVDNFALADPLLARLPPAADPYWRIGHFWRAVPIGYLDTLRSGKNLIRDPNLAEYYDHLALITRGGLWDWRRLVAIWNMNLGRYDYLLDAARRKASEQLAPMFQLAPDPTTAIVRFSKEITVCPMALPLACRGIFYEVQGDVADAVVDLSNAIVLNPNSGAAHNCLGSCYIKLGDVAKAEQHFRKAIAIAPDWAIPYRNLGYLLRSTRKDLAIDSFQKAIDCDPWCAEAHNNLGNLLAGSHPDEAWQHYLRALEIEPKYADAHNNLGAFLARHGQIDEAALHFGEALRLNPQFVAAKQNLARLQNLAKQRLEGR